MYYLHTYIEKYLVSNKNLFRFQGDFMVGSRERYNVSIDTNRKPLQVRTQTIESEMYVWILPRSFTSIFYV